MGIVYEGRDPNLDRRVAIKTVKVENLTESAAAEYEARFRTEARSAARLQHPNIVSVYDSDRDGDTAFLVMEFVQGVDLKHHIDQGKRYTLDQTLRIVRDLLSALDYAHKQGIVHRDVKPANLLVEPAGRVKLTDFGVARIQDSGEATRTQGSMIGTLKYMSPEQVQGLKIDSRADLFSTGVVLYQLLTDRRPFDGENDFSIIHQIIGQQPMAPSQFNPGLPEDVDAVVAKALAKDRNNRFATARDFAVALQAAVKKAEDASIVPVADPRKTSVADPQISSTTYGSASRKGTGTQGAGKNKSGSTGSTASVIQELELVYWKDIKDSVDAEELEGFLNKFPSGIYGDLARKRLKRLVDGRASDQTMLSGANLDDADATRVRPAYVAMPAAAPAAAGLSAAVSAEVGAAAVTASPADAAAPDSATVNDSPLPAAPAIPVVVPAAAPLPQTTGNADTTATLPEPSAYATASAMTTPAVATTATASATAGHTPPDQSHLATTGLQLAPTAVAAPNTDSLTSVPGAPSTAAKPAASGAVLADAATDTTSASTSAPAPAGKGGKRGPKPSPSPSNGQGTGAPAAKPHAATNEPVQIAAASIPAANAAEAGSVAAATSSSKKTWLFGGLAAAGIAAAALFMGGGGKDAPSAGSKSAASAASTAANTPALATSGPVSSSSGATLGAMGASGASSSSAATSGALASSAAASGLNAASSTSAVTGSATLAGALPVRGTGSLQVSASGVTSTSATSSTGGSSTSAVSALASSRPLGAASGARAARIIKTVTQVVTPTPLPIAQPRPVEPAARVVEPTTPTRVTPTPMPAAPPASSRPDNRPRANASPEDACGDKVFLALQFCLQTQCERASLRSHPICVKRREQDERNRNPTQ